MAQLALSWKQPQQQSMSRRSVQLRHKEVKFGKFLATEVSKALSMKHKAVRVKDSSREKVLGACSGEPMGDTGLDEYGWGCLMIFFR